MLRKHTLLYLASRMIAALGNMLAVAVFTRLSGVEVYGRYILMLAVSSIINGLAVQWLRYAFFANYEPDIRDRHLSSFIVLLGSSLGFSVILTAGAILLFGLNAAIWFGTLSLAISMGLFDSINEVFRTRLEVKRVVIAGLLRTFLIIALGTTALLTVVSPISLAIAVASANVLAALPSALAMRRISIAGPSRAAVQRLLVFGWPLLLSFGIGAIAQNVDRFILDWFSGPKLVGGYGAISDFVRASFTVFAEALAAGLVSIARQQKISGDEADARRTLAATYRSFVLLAGFGSAGFLVFGRLIFSIMFPMSFVYDVETFLPIIVCSSALLVTRNLYFGQVIYFNKASYLELISTVILFVTNTSVCLLLVPRLGAAGAAWAFLAGQTLSTCFFVAGSRGGFVMPVLLRPTIGVGILVSTVVALGYAVDFLGVTRFMSIGLKAIFFGAALAFGINILGIRIPRIRSL